MKYYETTYEEYIASVERYNMHPELVPITDTFPKHILQMENTIVYGPSGSGKYSQVLNLLKRYSPSQLKYDKKIIAQTEKQQYKYHISDIHYEIDMSLLGCNSKILWNEIFFQIVDIVSVKPDKFGIIVCKNFHTIHSELLEIFYSYMQQYNHSHSHIRIKFFILTEHISFLPNTIIHSSHILKVKRPTKMQYIEMGSTNKPTPNWSTNGCTGNPAQQEDHFVQSIKPQPLPSSLPQECIELCLPVPICQTYQNIFAEIDTDNIINSKEIYSFQLINDNIDAVPQDVFNIICDSLIAEMNKPAKILFTQFRDKLYDILTYNLDPNECLWYILKYYIETEPNMYHLSQQDITDILMKTHSFLKYFNNNYRPIFHLENMMYYIINKVHKFDGLRTGM